MMRKALTFILLLVLLHPVAMVAEPVFTGCRSREYTLERPLVYEDEWDKWPYSFINDRGEPDGFNIAIIDKVLGRLNIPYIVRLRSREQVREDFQNGLADLSLLVNAHYNASLGKFGKVEITYSENGLLQTRADSVGPYKMDDLRHIPFSVKKNSRAYYLAKENDFPDSLVSYVDNVEDEVLRISTEQKGAILWNKMMFKWIINKYHLQNLAISHIDLPAIPYNFISPDTFLLASLDSVSAIMKDNGEIEKITMQWMYPERASVDYTYLYIILGIVIVIVIAVITYRCVEYYRRYYTTNTMHDVCSNMSLMLKANDMQAWVYDPQTNKYAWMSSTGKVWEEFAPFEFAKNFYPDAQFNKILTAVGTMLKNNEDSQILNLRCYEFDADAKEKEAEKGRQETGNKPQEREKRKELDVEVLIRALRDDYGKVYLICGMQHDITHSKARLETMRLLHQRHKSAFKIALGAILYFDADGNLVDVNERCCAKMGIKDKDAVLAKGYRFEDFGAFDGIDFHQMPDDLRFDVFFKNAEMSKYCPIVSQESYSFELDFDDTAGSIGRRSEANQMPKVGYYYVHLMKSRDDEGNILSVTMFLLDITHTVEERKRLKRRVTHYAQLQQDRERYQNRRDYALRSNNIMMLRYLPDTKKLIFYDHLNQVQQELSQLRVLELVDRKDLKKVFHAFHKVDACKAMDVHLSIVTLLRNADGEQRLFSIDMHPVYADGAKVDSYFGICRDNTAHFTISEKLKVEEQRVHEAELLKQTFLRSTSYSIRHPLDIIRQSIDKLSEFASPQHEKLHIENIKKSTQRLLTYSDDTLLLSRIEAGLFVPSREVIDFVEVFNVATEEALRDYRTENVTYIIDNPYDRLEMYADPVVVKRILKETVMLSARYTQFGTLSVRYLYRKGGMSIAVQDTGHGIPPSLLDHIFEPRIGDTYSSEKGQTSLSGLEMPVCKALIDMLHGNIEIESNPGRGTSIYITLPISDKPE